MSPPDEKQPNSDGSITVTHPSGAQATIHPWGATVTSFRTASGRDLLYTSPLASFDGPKAIRGGVPIVFPQCRQPDPSLPNHGFLRINRWRPMNVSVEQNNKSHSNNNNNNHNDDDDNDNDNNLQEFVLSFQDDVVNGRGGIWENPDIDFEARYRIKIQEESFTTTLSVTNTGKVSFPFQILYHTYYRINNKIPHNVFLEGLDGYNCVNQDNQVMSKQKGYFTLIDEHTDCIFTPTTTRTTRTTNENDDISILTSSNNANTRNDLEVYLQSKDCNNSIQITAMGQIDDQSLPVSVCVWNPHITESESLKDFPNDGYQDMIGIEPGLLDNLPMLTMNQTVTFSVTTTNL